jgi:histidyl-tRNA synthetase
MTKEKKNKPSKELPLGFVDRQEKELLVRDFIISNIKEVMIKYGFQYLETPSFEYSDSIGNFYQIKIDLMKVYFHLRMKINGCL